MSITSWNAPATTPRVIDGRSLVHRRLDARQKAVLAADVVDGLATIRLTTKQLAEIFNVSVPYIALARELSPEKRSGIITGTDSTSFAGLLNAPAPTLALPAPNWKALIDDTSLFNIVSAVGIDRVLSAASAVEQATH
jgi:hypothetical protein